MFKKVFIIYLIISMILVTIKYFISSETFESNCIDGYEHFLIKNTIKIIITILFIPDY